MISVVESTNQHFHKENTVRQRTCIEREASEDDMRKGADKKQKVAYTRRKLV